MGLAASVSRRGRPSMMDVHSQPISALHISHGTVSACLISSGVIAHLSTQHAPQGPLGQPPPCPTQCPKLAARSWPLQMLFVFRCCDPFGAGHPPIHPRLMPAEIPRLRMTSGAQHLKRVCIDVTFDYRAATAMLALTDCVLRAHQAPSQSRSG